MHMKAMLFYELPELRMIRLAPSVPLCESIGTEKVDDLHDLFGEENLDD